MQHILVCVFYFLLVVMQRCFEQLAIYTKCGFGNYYKSVLSIIYVSGELKIMVPYQSYVCFFQNYCILRIAG